MFLECCKCGKLASTCTANYDKFTCFDCEQYTDHPNLKESIEKTKNDIAIIDIKNNRKVIIKGFQ